MIGRKVGHYRILERLGGGGMGVVYRAEDTKLGRSVALKFLPPELTRDDEARARFFHEARAAAHLDHPNICTVYDIGEADDDRVWIAMACYEGETLRKVIDERKLSVEEALQIVLQLARGLSKAHSSGIVHRDIKPANVMVTPDGMVKILDFGLAKLEGASQITGAGRALGTTMYMAPEQLLCKEVGPQADIWALGVVLFELITGHRPFRGEYEQAAIYSILNEEPSSLHASSPDVSPELERIIGRMLKRNLRERYQRVDDVVAELSALTGSGTKGSEIATAVRRLGTRVSRPLAAIAVLVFGAAAALFVISRTWDVSPSPAGAVMSALPAELVIGVLPFQDISEESLGPMLGSGFAEAMSASLGGVPGLQVVSAADQDSASGRNLRELCRITGTNLLLRGTLQRSEASVRCTWTLVDPDGFQRGSGSAEAPAGGMLSLRDSVSAQLLTALRRPGQLTPSTGPTDPSFAQDRYLQAVGYMVRYDREPSIDSAIEILETLGDAPRVQAALGSAYLHKYRLTGYAKEWVVKAGAACERAEASGADEPEVHRTLGRLYTATSKLDEAEVELKRALELRPDDAETKLAYGDLLYKQGRAPEAEATFRRAIELRPGNWAGHNQLGTFYLRSGALERALAAFRDAERLTPDNLYVLSNMGIALQWLARYDEAIAVYERANRLRPTAETFNNLGTLLYILERYDDAADAFERATALDPTDFQLWAGLGDSLRWSTNGKAKAPAAYRKAVELAEANLDVSPRDRTTLTILAVCEAKLGNSTRAVSLARLAVETDPENMIVNYNAGVAMELAGKRDLALKHIKHALEHGYTKEELRRDPELRTLAAETELLAVAKQGT
ncbi:MAG: protein kinase domain-containing protein [Thermoanaerobaculia bacterium]